jgi:hypothetical protein
MRNNNHYWDPTDNHNRKNETREKKRVLIKKQSSRQNRET